MIDPQAHYEAAAKGLNASPGGDGKIISTPTRRRNGLAGEAVVLELGDEPRRHSRPDPAHAVSSPLTAA